MHAVVNVRLVSPIACRCAGLRTSYLDRFRSAPDSDLGEQREALWGLLDDPAFVGCMATMNPQILGELQRDHARGRAQARRSGNVRHAERLLVRFLSRFVGRNDITGVAGTCFWGRFDEASSDNLAFTPPKPSPSKVRLVYASPAHLVHLEQLVRHRLASGSSRPAVAPRLRLTDGEVVDTLTGRVIPLDPVALRLLRRCDGRTPVSDLVADDPEHEARLDRLAEAGLVERHGTLPPLEPLDARLRAVVEELTSLEAVQADDTVATTLRELVEIEEELRSCRSRDLVRHTLQADERAKALGAYRPIDPVATLRRLLGACACDRECQDRIELNLSDRFCFEGDSLRDLSRHVTLELSDDQIELLGRFSGGATAAQALRGIRDDALADAAGPLSSLIERSILCLSAADPWGLSGTTRPELPWDPWEKAWFERAVAELERLELPQRYARPLRLVKSCRAVEQKSYEAVFPEFNPVSATDRARRAVAALGIAAVDAKKDRSFFLVDSLLSGASMVVGGALAADIRRQLGPVLALLGMRAWEWERRVLLPGLRTEIRAGSRVPLARALQWAEAWTREWEGPFRGASAPRLESRYDPESQTLEISGIDFPEEYEGWLADKRLVSTVDVMVAGRLNRIRDGRWKLILAEAHSSGDGLPETMHVPWTSHLPESGFTHSHADEVFHEDLLVMQPLLPTKQAHSIAWQLRGATLAVRNTGTGTAWSGPMVSLGDLDLVRAGDGFRVTGPERDFAFVSVDLSTGPVRTVRFTPRVFASRLMQLAGVRRSPDAEGVRVVPEIRVGGLIVCRRTHIVPPAMLGERLRNRGGPELLAAAGELRSALRLPRFVYVSLFLQKPFICDLESLFSLESLVNMLRRNVREIAVAEMSPEPSELWLEVGGGTVLAEWRFVACADGPDFHPSGPPRLE